MTTRTANGVTVTASRSRSGPEPNVTRFTPPDVHGQPGGGLSFLVKWGPGSALPRKLSERMPVLRAESRRLLRLMRTNRGSVFRGGYPIPLVGGGTPVLSGKLRRSAFVTVTATGMRFGWRRTYAYALNYGYTVRRSKAFEVDGRRIVLSRGHRVRARRFAEETYKRWYTEMAGRVQAFRKTGKDWSKYR